MPIVISNREIGCAPTASWVPTQLALQVNADVYVFDELLSNAPEIPYKLDLPRSQPDPDMVF